jgi:hypothetical protein
VLVTKQPDFVSNQYAASAPLPTGMIADRSFSETPMTRGASAAPLGAPDASFISSPSVLTSSRRGDAAAASGAPTGFTVVSVTLATVFPDSRSNQSFPMIPLTDGVAPDNIVACPIAVTVG